MKRQHYPLFDWIRLFLAIEVVLQHFGKVATGRPWVAQLNAVPVFVALSGFMILTSLESSKTAWEFWFKRIRRVMPALLCSLTLVYALFGWSQIGPTLQSYWSFGMTPAGMNGALWSLSCEEVLYLALFVLFSLRLTSAIATKILFGIATAWALFAFTPFAITHIVDLRIQSILLPCFCLGLMFKRCPEITLPVKPACLALAVGVAGWLYIMQFGGRVMFVTTIATIIQCWALLSLGVAVKVPRIKADLSYGIYVYHSPILAYFGMMGLHSWQLAASVAVSLAASTFASFYLIERPAVRLMNWKPKLVPLGSKPLRTIANELPA